MKKTEQNATGNTRSVARLACALAEMTSTAAVAQKEVVALEDQLQRALKICHHMDILFRKSLRRDNPVTLAG